MLETTDFSLSLLILFCYHIQIFTSRIDRAVTPHIISHSAHTVEPHLYKFQGTWNLVRINGVSYNWGFGQRKLHYWWLARTCKTFIMLEYSMEYSIIQMVLNCNRAVSHMDRVVYVPQQATFLCLVWKTCNRRSVRKFTTKGYAGGVSLCPASLLLTSWAAMSFLTTDSPSELFFNRSCNDLSFIRVYPLFTCSQW